MPPSPETIAVVLSDFLTDLREALLDQEPYHDLIQREMLRALREIVAELRPVAYDDEATYRAQVAEMYRQLEFVGIPELKERRPITVEDIFIKLRAEREVEPEAELELLETYHRAEETGDKETLLRLREARNVVAHAQVARTRIAIEEALRETNRLVVLGDPGAGKTTLLKYLTVICAEGRAPEELGLTAGRDSDSPLPIFVPLREFAAEGAQREEDYSLLNHLYTCARERLLLNPPPGFFEEAMADGRCLVCLDGLDEVWAVGQRKSVRDAVKALAARYPRNRYVVTSRIVGYGEAPLNRREFTHHTILPFEDDDIRDFVHKWYTIRERDPLQRKQKVDDLIGTIEREPRIRSLAQNPLLLTIIALVHRIEAELPHERVKLYDKCVTALVETWEEVKGLSLEEKQRPFYRYRRRLLERLAYELHAGAEEPGQLQTVKEGDLELLLGQFLMEYKRLGLTDDPDGARDEARAFIHLARGRTGLLVERGEGVFGFPHLTLQEYLAACDIENRCIHRGVDAIWEEIESRLHDPHWREVILLLLGSLNKYDEPPTLLVEKILEAGEGDKFEPVLHRHLYLAARALADRVDVANDLYRQIVSKLLDITCKRPESEALDALDFLSHIEGYPDAANVLMLLTVDSQREPWVRIATAITLAEWGWVYEGIDALLILPTDSEIGSSAPWFAALGLAHLGRTEEAVDALLSLAHDPQVEVGMRSTAALVLGQLGRAEQAADVLLALARDPQAEVAMRSTAASALGQLGRAEGKVIEGLLGLVRDEVDAGVRRSAVSALGQLGRAEEKVVESLLWLAREEKVDAGVRRSAAETLGQLGRAEEAAEVLLALARDSQVGTGVRRSAASALEQLGHAEEAGEILLWLARDEKVDVRARLDAASSLGQLGWAEEKVIEGLLGLARDEKVATWVRSEAASSLGQLGRAEEAGEILLGLAHDEKVAAGVRRTAAEALGELGRAEEAGEMLLELARDEEVGTGVRLAATSALGQLGWADEKMLEGLLGLAQDEEVDTRLSSRAYESLKALVGMATD